MHNLLIAATIDLAGGEWFSGCRERVVASLLMGKAGDVRHGNVPSAMLASRAARPAAGGRQPRAQATTWQARPDGSFVLFAGVIFERDDIARRFALQPGLGHAETYAALYETVGEQCDRLIVGNYAVLHWFPEHRRVRMARSPLSLCPLHIWRRDDRLAIASIPRALFAAGASSELDNDKLADALLLNLRKQTDNWYKDLSRVAPGTVETHDPGGVRVERFWSIDTVAPVRFRRDSDYVEAVDEQFRRAAKASLEGIERPGLFLSGGLDSQAVASYLLEQIPPDERLRTYTSVPIDGKSALQHPMAFGDETANVRAFAQMHPRIDANFVSCPDAKFGEKLDTLFMLGSWPVHNEMSGHWTHAIYALALSDGCDVMMTGGGGNAGFSYAGRTGYPTWLRQGKWLRLAREIACSDDPRPWWRKFVADSILPNLPLSWQIVRDRRRTWLYPSPFQQWCALREDFARSSGALQRAHEAGHDITFHAMRSARDWRGSVIADMQAEAPELHTAFHLMYGLNQRDPTAFLPLLELCMGIPDEQYLRDGETRWLARRLLRGRIPESVRTERRSGRQSSDWHLRFAREREALLDELDGYARDPRIAGMLDVERMARDLREWPGPEGPQGSWVFKLKAGLSRGVAHARFVRYVEGRNAG